MDDANMLRKIVEAHRVMEVAAVEIVDLRKRIHDLEEENARLRTRCTAYAVRLRRIEEGEL